MAQTESNICILQDVKKLLVELTLAIVVLLSHAD